MHARIPVHLAATSSILPGPPITTAELASRITPPPDPRVLEERTGIRTRHFLEPGGSGTQLAIDTIRLALERADLAADQLARIIFVSSSSGDVLVPANANAIASALGLRGTCDCFDLNNACMGFLTAFDLTARAIATGYGTTAIVAVDLPSRYITPEDPRPYVVFGDGAAAAILQPSSNGEGILGSWLRNDGSLSGVNLPHPGVTRRNEIVRFNASNKEMTQRAVELVETSAREVLQQAGLTLDDVDWILPHQPNGVILRTLIETLSVPAERVIPIVDRAGSLGCVSIALSLDVLMRSGRMRGGERILMIGVGAGVSAGAILLQLR